MRVNLIDNGEGSSGKRIGKGNDEAHDAILTWRCVWAVLAKGRSRVSREPDVVWLSVALLCYQLPFGVVG